MKAAYQISFCSDIRELRYTLNKLTENYEETRGQRPNESQKAVIIYMMKSVGEIALMWPVV